MDDNNPTPTQDPKYSFASGRLVNSATLQPIPEDEPVFMLRGRDVHALDTLWPYLDACPPGPQRDAIRASIVRFERFAKEHPDRMKEPDTTPEVYQGFRTQRYQPSYTDRSERWSLGAIDGDWREIDHGGHPGFLRVIWWAEEDASRAPEAELMAQWVVNVLNGDIKP
jgi:hypothetical protein